MPWDRSASAFCSRETVLNKAECVEEKVRLGRNLKENADYEQVIRPDLLVDHLHLEWELKVVNLVL